jgi:vacuolar-type H+-ATPase subunit E/Vma4
VDYLFDVGADRLVILEGMLRQVLPRYAGDTDVMAAFQQRLMALGVIWHDPPGAEGLAERILRGAFAQAGRIEAGALAQAKQVTDDARARAEALEREAEDRYISGRLDPAMDQADQAMADVIAVVRHEAEEALGRARREADDILTEARSQFEQITSDARARAESLERDAQKRHGQAMGSLVQSREELERRVDDLRAFERTYRVRLIRYHDEALRELRGEAEAEGRAEAEGGEQQ